MQKYHDTIQDEAGNVVTTATVTVYNANTGTPSSIYDDDEVTPLANPFTVANSNYDINGNIFFKAANGDYDVKVVVGANTSWKYDVTLYDVDDNTNIVNHNFTATTDPTVNDDSSAGYSEGSTWINQTLDDAYRCVDDTVGAAVWIKTTLQSTDLGALAVLNTVNNDQWLGTDLSIANGGTGQSTAQAAIDALSQVSGATNEHVLTKDTATGNAVFKAAPGATPEIETITATVAANALTCGAPAGSVDFRDATLTSGAVTTITHGVLSLVVPDTATLGTVSAVQSRLYLLKINNAGTVELAIVNSSGGNDLSETGVISTTALSTGSDSANVIYSTTARTNVPYRVVGFIESTQATAGTWATAPSLIQGAGGNALKSLSTKNVVRLNTPNGHGSTNTKIRRFTNVITNIGPDITYADSATLGMSCTINTDGVYSISYSDNYTTAQQFGISLNSSELTTDIQSVTTLADVLVQGTTLSGSLNDTVSVTLPLSSGDVIRAHDQGNAEANTRSFFTIARVD